MSKHAENTWHWLQLGTGAAIIPFGFRKKHLSVSLLFPKLESSQGHQLDPLHQLQTIVLDSSS
jgi:hypothetical protein